MVQNLDLKVYFPSSERILQDLSSEDFRESPKEVLTEIYKQFIPGNAVENVKYPILSKFHLGYLLGDQMTRYEKMSALEYLGEDLQRIIDSVSRTHMDFEKGYTVYKRLHEVRESRDSLSQTLENSILKTIFINANPEKQLSLADDIHSLLQIKRSVNPTQIDKKEWEKDTMRLEAKLKLWKRDEVFNIHANGDFIAEANQSLGKRDIRADKEFTIEEDIWEITEALSKMDFILDKIINPADPIKFFQNLWLIDFVDLVGNRLDFIYQDLIMKFLRESPGLINFNEA